MYKERESVCVCVCEGEILREREREIGIEQLVLDCLHCAHLKCRLLIDWSVRERGEREIKGTRHWTAYIWQHDVMVLVFWRTAFSVIIDILNINNRLLDAIASKDWATYRYTLYKWNIREEVYIYAYIYVLFVRLAMYCVHVCTLDSTSLYVLLISYIKIIYPFLHYYYESN